jgi:acetylornithine deacetylase/succinyl-diaminopimelate desuccinylase-like protein/pimeloyl-ACP methyl ester carboxylesterase
MGHTHFATLPDGRRVSYADHGDPAGPTVLYCLGTPESRLLAPAQVRPAEQLGIRLVVPDRPGFGQSDPKPGRTLLGWPDDAAALLDQLGVGTFSVVGGSGGGPYAVACGVRLGERVTAVGLVAPAPPRDAPAHGFVPLEEAALRARGERMAELLRDDPDGFYALVEPDLSETDRARLAAADRDRLTAMFREAFRQGADAYVEDHLINAGPWSDLLPRLARPTRIWQGDDDTSVPPESTRWLAARIPGAQLTLLAGSGHQVPDEVWPEVYRWALNPGQEPGRTVLEAARAYRREHAAEIVADYAGLLALDNVTGDVPALRRNAAEIVRRFRARGAEAEAVSLDGAAPLVVGRVPARPGAPRLGVYVHYDGQPVTPAAWATPPFEPRLLAAGREVAFPAAGEPVEDEWRLHARAAADDKAPLAALLAALDAVAAAGAGHEVELVLCFEGEEESGSTHLGDYLRREAGRLAADAWLICDGPVQESGAPQVVLGVRGFCDLELTVYGAAGELHSGHYGNWAPNPALELARLLASMKDAEGRVTVAGFTADTRPPSPAEQAVLAALPPVEDALLARLGLAAAEVPGSRLLDRLMLPSLNVRGLRAADVGPAARNVIPAAATASLDIRLAAGDDPERMLDRVREHVRAQGYLVLDREPTAAERRGSRLIARIDARPGYPAARAPLELPVVAHLLELAGRATGRPAVVLPTGGGSVPLHHFAEVLGAPAVILPIANPDNNQHAANENLRLGNLWYGVDLWTLLLTTPWRR